MKKLASGLTVYLLLGASLAAKAHVLDFNTWVVGASGNAVPLLAESESLAPGGFVDDRFTYKGFTFEYRQFAGVPASHAWIWLTEGSSFGLLGDRYKSGPTPPDTGNGFLVHGCQDDLCSDDSTTSFAISNPTPFTFQSLDMARFAFDDATIHLFTNVDDLVPALTIDAPTSSDPYLPVTVFNTLAPSQLFTKITVDGFKGYYGIDNIVYTPVPEPASVLLTGTALLGAIGASRRRIRVATAD